MTESYYDGEWRPIITDLDVAIDKLLSRGFEIRISKGKYMARWPFALPYYSLIFIGVSDDEVYGMYAIAQVDMANWQKTGKAGS